MQLPRSAQRAAPAAARLRVMTMIPVMEREVDLDAVLERRRQDAICNGNMIDLAADVDDEQLQRCTVWKFNSVLQISHCQHGQAKTLVWSVVMPHPSVCKCA